MNTVHVTHGKGTDTWRLVDSVRWAEGVLILRMENRTVSYTAHNVFMVVAELEEDE